MSTQHNKRVAVDLGNAHCRSASCVLDGRMKKAAAGQSDSRAQGAGWQSARLDPQESEPSVANVLSRTRAPVDTEEKFAPNVFFFW